MKKKIFTIIFMLLMFIPIMNVKAFEMSLKRLSDGLNERFANSVSGIEGTVKAEYNESNGTLSIKIDGIVYVIYEYDNTNKVLKFKGIYQNNLYLLEEVSEEEQSNRTKLITKEVIFEMCNIKGDLGHNDNEISYFLRKTGVLYNNDNLNTNARTKKDGIEVKTEDGRVKEFNIYFNEIGISNYPLPSSYQPNSQGIIDFGTLGQEEPKTTPKMFQKPKLTETTTETKTTEKSEETTSLKENELKTEDKNYEIKFKDNTSEGFKLSVETLSQAIEENSKNEKKLKDLNEILDKVKEETKENGSFIELYEVKVKLDEKEKTDGTFTFKIKMTNEMKKYNKFRLVNINDKFKKADIIQLKKDGEYLIGELPHLSMYALVGEGTTSETVKNPKTGVETYIVTGSILLVVTASLYVAYKRKNTI